MSTVPECVQIGDAVIYQQLNDEAVLLDMGSQEYFGLDDVGTRMWQLLMENGNVEYAISELTSIYDADQAIIRSDIYRLISDLLAAKLLKAGQ